VRLRVRPLLARLPALLLLGLAAAPSRAEAGAANATLRCEGKDGKAAVKLEGEIPGDFAEFQLTLSRGKDSLELSEASDEIHVVEAFADKAFSFVVTRKDGRHLKLYARPATVKPSKGAHDAVDASFEAVLLEGPKPGHSGPVDYEAFVRNVKLRCQYHYSI
jgi:hypothetical protein